MIEIYSIDKKTFLQYKNYLNHLGFYFFENLSIFKEDLVPNDFKKILKNPKLWIFYLSKMFKTILGSSEGDEVSSFMEFSQ